MNLTHRRQRIEDLLTARARIDAELAALTANLPELAADLPEPRTRASIAGWAQLARELVQSGKTHAEVAYDLSIPLTAVDALITHRPKGAAAA